MRPLLTTLAILLAVSGLASLVWLGQQRPPDPYLEDIMARGTLRIGIDPTYPPFDTLVDGKPAGYDVELGNAIAAELGVRPAYTTLALDTLYDALATEQVDVLISALPFVYERQREVRYSHSYYQAGQVIVVPSGDSSISGPQGLAGRTAAVELGSNADTEARRLSRTITPTLSIQSTYRSPDEALDALVRGEADAAITDNLSARTYATANPGTLRVVQPPLTNDPYVIAMPVRAEGLAGRIDATIERLRASGELARMMGLPSP